MGAELRTRARNTNSTMAQVAEAVTLSHPLLSSRPARDDG